MPWLTNNDEGGFNLKQVALEVAEAIASPFQSEDGKTFQSFKAALKDTRVEQHVRVVEPEEDLCADVSSRSISRAERKVAKRERRVQLNLQIIWRETNDCWNVWSGRDRHCFCSLIINPKCLIICPKIIVL